MPQNNNSNNQIRARKQLVHSSKYQHNFNYYLKTLALPVILYPVYKLIDFVRVYLLFFFFLGGGGGGGGGMIEQWPYNSLDCVT